MGFVLDPGYGDGVPVPVPLSADWTECEFTALLANGDAPRLLVVVFALEVGCDDSKDVGCDDFQFVPAVHGVLFADNVFPGVLLRECGLNPS